LNNAVSEIKEKSQTQEDLYMLECGNCKVFYHDEDRLQKCPVCSSNLCYKSSADNPNGININLGFTFITCDVCKSTYDCSVKNCDACGEVFEFTVDRLVEARKKKFDSVFDRIAKLEDDFKIIKLGIKDGTITKTEGESIEFINCFMADFSSIVDKGTLIFSDLDLSDDAITGKKASEIANEIIYLFESLFELRKKLIITEVEAIYTNLFARVNDAFMGYLNSIKLVSKCIVSNTFTEAKTLMNEAQIKLNEASNSLDVINKILGTYRLISKTNPSEDKTVDYYDALVLCTFFIETDDVEDLSDMIEKTEEDIYKYFSFALPENKEYYGNNSLLLLAPFMTLSLFSFRIIP